MHQGSRFKPRAVRPDRVVRRARLTRLLNGRFDHRVTTIIGAAGYGKSTALALAIESNELDPAGRDIWLGAVPADADPTHFVNGLATALDVVPTGDGETVRKIGDALWSAAPEDVAVIIDDAHHLVGTPSSEMLRELLDAMPTNAHLVLGSRHPLDIPLARLRAHGDLLEITESDLALDDDEADTLRNRKIDRRASSPASPSDSSSLPRHVATADLQLAAGIDASADFLWEEILSGLEPDRLLHLRRAAVLDELDDELVRALTDGQFGAAALVRGVPLVDPVGDSGLRMHAILREALIARLEPGERRKTLELAADAERARRQFPIATRLYHDIGDHIAALDTAREYALTPIVFQSVEATTAIKQIVDRIDADSPTALALEAISRFGGLEHQLIPLFERAAAEARARDDVELEIAALNRVMQALLLDHRGGFEPSVERAAHLGAISPSAASVAAHFRSIMFQLAGDADRAIDELDLLGDLDPAREYVTRASRFCDLGRPEEVAVGLGPDEIGQLPPGAELFVGLAMWHRGEAPPDIANALGEEMIRSVLRRGFTHPSVSTLAVTAIIALAAGESSLAERHVRHAVELSAAGVGASITDLVTVARAALAAVHESDEVAVEILAGLSDGGGNWPTRAHFLSLPLVYICAPQTRPLLRRGPFGPSMSTAVDAGAAVVALRDDNDTAPAVALPWTQPNLLRAHVLSTHLAELACAAIAGGNSSARGVLEMLPRLADLLDRVVATSGASAVAVAQSMRGSIPRVEPFRLHAALLGPVELHHDGTATEHVAFTNRPKVRELFALLLERGRMQRLGICELLWPQHDDEDKALASLRTALSSLNDAMQPDRARGDAAFHLVIDGDSVALDRRISTDLSEFEDVLAEAQSDDHAGLPARALDAYLRCVAMYRGPYLQGVDASWIVLPRIRLQTLAIAAMCRVAELTAAKGEPEEATRWAARARQIDPLNERAGRIFVAGIDAMGDPSAARTAASELLATLHAAGLEATAPTRRLIARLTSTMPDHLTS